MSSKQYGFICASCPFYGTDKCDRQALWCALSFLTEPNEAQQTLRAKVDKVQARLRRREYFRAYYQANREKKLHEARERRLGRSKAVMRQAALTTEQKLQARLVAYRAEGVGMGENCLTVGSLFSGIGGLDLGLEQAGMRTVWQVEYDDWARGKLAENFPHTEKFKDVREVGKHNLKPVDLICGGFPCQDLSTLNVNRKGLEGQRSGLWAEYARIVCEMRPRFVVIENVTALLRDGLDRVLCDLAGIGYDAEWQTLRAASFGQPTRRERLFVVAYPSGVRPSKVQILKRVGIQGYDEGERLRARTTLRLKDWSYTVPQIPEHLRMDNGLSFELLEIEAAVKGYGNAVCPPVAKWIGERIIEFDSACLFAPESATVEQPSLLG